MANTATEEQYGDDQSNGGAFESFPETGDLSAVSNTIPAASKVLFTIASMKPNVYRVEGEVRVAKLQTRLTIGPDGINGEGSYAGKSLFVDLITWIDSAAYPTWNALVDFKQFLNAMDLPVNPAPRINEELVADLIGREVVANITRTPRKTKVDGQYVPTGEFENLVKNFRKAE